MNIFEALSQGKGSINEENTSSFLAYLLKDNESHGLRREFVKRFVQLVDINYKDIDDSNFIVELEKEYICANQNKSIQNSSGPKHKRIIDILITITEGYKNYIIGIENKLSTSSCQKNQLLEEYTYIKQAHSKNNNEIKMIFLVPNTSNKQVQIEFQTLINTLSSTKEKQNIKCVCWDDVINIIAEMIKDEAEAKISPMSDYLKQTLKAFCYYIKNINNLIIKQKIPVKYIKKDTVELYELLQLSDGSIRIRCENSKDLIPKLMCYDILFKLKPKLYSKKRLNEEAATKIIDGNTRELGALVFEVVHEKNLKEIEIDDKNALFSVDLHRTGSNEY